MIYKQYGITDKQVSALGFGGMRFKKEDYENGDFSPAVRIIHRASELGVNYFDTAPLYCDDKSEEIFGEAFKAMPNPYYVSTKSMYKYEPTADDVRRRAELSLKRLGVDKINFYNMWCILDLERYGKVMAKGGPYEGAQKLKDEGLIEHICCSAHASGSEIEKIVNDGAFDGITLGYNVLNFKFRQQGINAAYKKGVGIVTMNPLGGGIIPQNEDRFAFLSASEGQSPTEGALMFNMSQDAITVALVGMASVAEVETNVAALEKYPLLTTAQIETISSHLSTELNTLCTGCQYCDRCPVGVPVPKLMDAYNQYILTGSEKRFTGRLSGMWHSTSALEDAKKCIECGACERACTQHLPIIERLKQMCEYYDNLPK